MRVFTFHCVADIDIREAQDHANTLCVDRDDEEQVEALEGLKHVLAGMLKDPVVPESVVDQLIPDEDEPLASVEQVEKRILEQVAKGKGDQP
jgi:hypothetical protein